MAVPVILVDGLQPPPLGVAANGYKTNGATIALSLQSTAGIGSVQWIVECSSDCTATVAIPSPSYPYSTTATLNGVGTYRIRCYVNGNQAGNEYAVAAVAVRTANRNYRKPLIGETTEWDPVNGWSGAFAQVVDIADQIPIGSETDSPWANGKTRSTYFNVNTTDATVTTAVSFAQADGTTVGLYGSVIGRAADGTSYSADIAGTYKRVSGGAPTLVGLTPIPVNVRADAGASAWTVGFVVSGNSVNLSVTGAAATTIAWSAVLQSCR